MPTDYQALETALKTAVSDGIKRALRVFGESLGNSLYDKDFVREVKAGKHRDREMVTRQIDSSWLANGAASTSTHTGSLIQVVNNSQQQQQQQQQQQR